MRHLVAELKIERATPHDLRRTCLTTSYVRPVQHAKAIS